MLLELAQWLAKDIRAFNVFSYITLRAVLACLTALVPFRGRPFDDTQADGIQDRTGRARRWTSEPSDESGHAHHGRRADPRVGGRHDAAVGRSEQPLRMGRPLGHDRVRRGRLGGRLPQSGSPQPERPFGPHEILLAVGVRDHGGVLHRVFHESASSRPLLSFLFSSRSPIRSELWVSS